MVVYIDILFILNLFADYFIILAVEKLCRTPTRALRRILASSLGALYSLSIFIDMNFFFSILLRAVSAVTIVLAAFGYKNLKRFLRLTSALFCVSFIYAGIMMAVWFVAKPANMVVNNGVVYFDISPLILIISTMFSYFILTIIRKFMRRPLASSKYYNIAVTYKDSTVYIKALLDTGHALTDPFSDAPVIVAEYNTVKEIIPHRAREYFLSKKGTDNIPEDLKGKIRLIPYKSVGGEGVLPALSCDRVEIIYENCTSTIKKAVLAVSPQGVGDGYGALISSDLINSGSEADVGISESNVKDKASDIEASDKIRTSK